MNATCGLWWEITDEEECDYQLRLPLPGEAETTLATVKWLPTMDRAVVDVLSASSYMSVDAPGARDVPFDAINALLRRLGVLQSGEDPEVRK